MLGIRGLRTAFILAAPICGGLPWEERRDAHTANAAYGFVRRRYATKQVEVYAVMEQAERLVITVVVESF